ncbi:MAG: hypothetical protein V2A58_14640 [Planctomycetota bacterium]
MKSEAEWVAHFKPFEQEYLDRAGREAPDKARQRVHFAVCETCDQRKRAGTCANCASLCGAANDKRLTELTDRPLGKWDNPTLLDKPMWADLYNYAKGKTFLVMGRGPSRDELNLNAIERDFTIACNLRLWEPAKQTATKIDFDVAVDEGPCKVPVVAGTKRISGANTKGGKAARTNCWWIFPHLVYNWGQVERGKPLPSVFNTGVAALTLAVYMGAKRIRVVGIEYAPFGHGGMHLEDSPEQRALPCGHRAEREQVPAGQVSEGDGDAGGGRDVLHDGGEGLLADGCAQLEADDRGLGRVQQLQRRGRVFEEHGELALQVQGGERHRHAVV